MYASHSTAECGSFSKFEREELYTTLCAIYPEGGQQADSDLTVHSPSVLEARTTSDHCSDYCRNPDPPDHTKMPPVQQRPEGAAMGISKSGEIVPMKLPKYLLRSGSRVAWPTYTSKDCHVADRFLRKLPHSVPTQSTSKCVKKEVVCDKIIKKKDKALNEQGAESKVMTLLSEKASQVEVDRQLLNKAEGMFNMKLETWKEFTFQDIVTGIEEDDMEKYGESLAETLGSGIISCCKKIKYGSSTGGKVETVKFEADEFTSAYGFQAHIRDRD